MPGRRGHPEGPTTLYRVYDANDTLLYVGIARSWAYRFTSHSGLSWWAKVATARLETLPSRKAAFAAEAEAIRVEGPLHNVAGNPHARLWEPPPRNHQSPASCPVDSRDLWRGETRPGI